MTKSIVDTHNCQSQTSVDMTDAFAAFSSTYFPRILFSHTLLYTLYPMSCSRQYNAIVLQMAHLADYFALDYCHTSPSCSAPRSCSLPPGLSTSASPPPSRLHLASFSTASSLTPFHNQTISFQTNYQLQISKLQLRTSCI